MSVGTSVIRAMRGMAALCAQLLGNLRALCEGAVGVAARVVVGGGLEEQLVKGTSTTDKDQSDCHTSW